MTDKLAMIKTLGADELRGWFRIITGTGNPYNRAPFDGELAAMHDRAARIGINLERAKT